MTQICLGARLNFQGQKIRPEEIIEIARRAVLPASPQEELWTSVGVGLFTLPLQRRSGDSSPETGLFVQGNRALAFSGVLDNREDLRRELRLGSNARDGQIVLAAYQAWEKDFLIRLLGDFALVLWDGDRDRLLAARDPLGVRELFFSRTPHALSLASQVRILVDPSAISPTDLDQEYFADFLALNIHIDERTPFRQIKRLLAGHALLAERGTISTFCFWDLEAPAESPFRNLPEAAERFRELFSEAVLRSLQTPGHVWAELSGGLDSSSIAAMAGRLGSQDGQTNRKFATVTMTWPQTPASDEREWAERVLESVSFPGHFLNGDDLFFEGALNAASYRNDPHFGILCFPFLSLEAAFLKENGVDVLLCGERAEAVTLDALPGPLHMPVLLRELRLKELAGDLRSWQAATHEPYLNLLYWSCLRPLFRPRTLHHSVHTIREVEPWVRSDYAKRFRLKERVRFSRFPRRFRDPVLQYQYERIKRSEGMVNRGHLDWSIESRYPFLYRPLVEFCFSLPWRIKAGPGVHKALIRAAMQGTLPEKVRLRYGGKGPTEAAFKAFARRWEAIEPMAKSSVLVQLGIFEENAWREALLMARHGHASNFGALTSSLALEYWLRSAFPGSVRNEN